MKADVLANGGRVIDPDFTTVCKATIEIPLGQGVLLRPKWALLGVVAEPDQAG